MMRVKVMLFEVNAVHGFQMFLYGPHGSQAVVVVLTLKAIVTFQVRRRLVVSVTGNVDAVPGSHVIEKGFLRLALIASKAARTTDVMTQSTILHDERSLLE